MEKIKVIDDFLEPDELKIVTDMLRSKSFNYYHTSNGSLKNETPFWTTYLNDEPYVSEYITSIIEKHFFKKFIVERVYCNAQTFGQDGSFHIDSNDDHAYTFCLYINHVKKEDVELAGGYLYFKLPELNYKI